MIPASVQRSLLQGELADLALYRSLRVRAKGDFAKTLDHFIKTEERHVDFWRRQFDLPLQTPHWSGCLRNLGIGLCVHLFGAPAGYLALEAVEAHGIKQYLSLWEQIKDEQTREGLRTILTEELSHEDEAATGGERTVNGGLVRNIFLGFNDGSVEILGAVSGLAAALGRPELVAVSAATVSIAGAMSMGIGAFLSTHAENEIETREQQKQQFLSGSKSSVSTAVPWKSALIVGASYLIGAAVPVAPFFFGATHAVYSIVLSGSLILIVSVLLAFLSGMDIRRRVLLNGCLITFAVLVSYVIGSFLDPSHVR